VEAALSQQLAAATNGQQEFQADGPLMLRAQIVIAAALGLVLLRSSAAMPISAAPEQHLPGPLSDLVNAMLSHGSPDPRLNPDDPDSDLPDG
jgi:hypothetical protein